MIQKLPQEIQTIIWSMYWKSEFNDHVINNLHETKILINRYILFLIKHVLTFCPRLNTTTIVQFETDATQNNLLFLYSTHGQTNMV